MKWLGLPILKQLYRLARDDSKYLPSRGWFLSAIGKRPVDADGNPVPWLTYPFVDFIRPRLHMDMTVVEFGAGQSTLFWASRVSQVFSVEDNPAWFAELRPQLPTNATVLLQTLDPNHPMVYAQAADQMKGRADIVLVDGPERDLTLRNAVNLLRGGGVVVLDNAGRVGYADACLELTARQGFRRLDFIGMAPGGARECSTALFYRDGNCLGV